MSAITQADLARECGLARQTVTQILNGRIIQSSGAPIAKQETIDRVLAAAEAAGYERPGESGKSMAAIGQALGLSHVAVRSALRGDQGHSQVSAETRARVLAKAEEVGYEPPPLVRRTRRDRWW